MRTHTRLDAARLALCERGGWLLTMGGGVYLVTRDEGLVRELRGNEFLERCARLGRRDKTALISPAPVRRFCSP
jgi:hypothetical protein